MLIPYDYYKVFYYVARYQSINKAAKVLSNSQPNITRIISRLEDMLDCRLFVRSSKGAKLTEQGEALYAHVKIAQKQLKLAEAEMDSFRNPQQREVVLGLSRGIISSAFQEIIIPAIITSDVNSKEMTKENILTTFRDVVIAGRAYADTFRKPVSLDELSTYPLIGFGRNTEVNKLYDRFFAEKGIDFAVSIETDTPEQVLAFVSGNLGIGFIPPTLLGLKHAMEEGEVFQVNLKDTLPERRISVVRNENQANSKAAILEDYILRYKEQVQTRQDSVMPGSDFPTSQTEHPAVPALTGGR